MNIVCGLWLVCSAVLTVQNVGANAIGKIIGDLRIENTIKSDITAMSSDEFASSSVESIEDSVMSLEDQVRLLSKQMSALMTHRREDYQMLEESLKISVHKSAQQFGQAELHEEVLKLR